MAEVTNKLKKYNLIDVYGHHFAISTTKRDAIKFTLYHSDIDEGYARKEFEYLSVMVDANMPIYNSLSELYERIGNSFNQSVDPIRDGRNGLILDADFDNETYFITFCRDLSNELAQPGETTVAFSDSAFKDFVENLNIEEKGYQYQMKPMRNLA